MIYGGNIMYTFELERFVREDLGEDDDSTGIVPGSKSMCQDRL